MTRKSIEEDADEWRKSLYKNRRANVTDDFPLPPPRPEPEWPTTPIVAGVIVVLVAALALWYRSRVEGARTMHAHDDSPHAAMGGLSKHTSLRSICPRKGQCQVSCTLDRSIRNYTQNNYHGTVHQHQSPFGTYVPHPHEYRAMRPEHVFPSCLEADTDYREGQRLLRG